MAAVTMEQFQGFADRVAQFEGRAQAFEAHVNQQFEALKNQVQATMTEAVNHMESTCRMETSRVKGQINARFGEGTWHLQMNVHAWRQGSLMRRMRYS